MGTFVEVKNSAIGPGAKVPHLSYIGDADVGERANLGAGTITANYDGHAKHRTTIGKRVRGGVDTAFVAPVTVGDDAYTAAGSVIVEDVPPGALGVARARGRSTARGTRSVVRSAFTLRGAMSSAMDTRAERRATSLPIDYNKRLMLFSRARQPAAGGGHRRQAANGSRPGDVEDVLQRRGVLPL